MLQEISVSGPLSNRTQIIGLSFFPRQSGSPGGRDNFRRYIAQYFQFKLLLQYITLLLLLLLLLLLRPSEASGGLGQDTAPSLHINV